MSKQVYIVREACEKVMNTEQPHAVSAMLSNSYTNIVYANVVCRRRRHK